MSTPIQYIETNNKHWVLQDLLEILMSRKGLTIALLLSMFCSLFVGAYVVPFSEFYTSLIEWFYSGKGIASDPFLYMLIYIRLPRVVLSVVVGGGLAAAGAAIQGLFRNPLADPALIGLTSGAMTFAVAGIVFASLFMEIVQSFLGYTLITFLAFIGSLLSTLLVYWLATKKGRTSVTTMLLAGIAVTALGGALTGLMTYFSSEDELRDITFWTLGSLAGVSWQMLAIIIPMVLIAISILLFYAPQLDLMLLGEQEAAYMGSNIQQAKWGVIGGVALAVGACVAVSGVIAFVALVVPHLIRLVKGPRHHNLILSAALLGGVLLLLADMFARTIIAPAELPIGIITALIGAPFFIGLLLKKRDQLW